MFLKKSTAVDIVVGPFVDDEDGATLKTGLTIAQADVQLSKNAGSFAQKNNATSATHLKDGQYKVPLSTTDTDTNGYMRVSITMSGCLPVWAEYLIIPANVYDSLVGGSASLDVSATSVRSAVGLGSANLDTQLSGINSKTTNLPGSPAAVGSAMTLSDGAITAAKIASNAITDAKIANNAITGDKVATTAVTKIQSGLATSSALTTVGGNVSAIPTNPLLTNDVRLGNLDAKVSDVKTQTDKIPASPAAVGSKMKLDNDAIDANVIKADAVTKIQSGLATPTNITGGTITNLTNLPSAPADWLTASAVKADAVTKVQNGLATSANVSTVGSKVDGLNDITAQEVWEYNDRELSTPANYKADISGLATASALSTVGGKVDNIKTKTDNLPANTSTAIGAIPTNPLLTNDARLNNLDAKVSDVKAKTDKIPNQPAPAGEYDTQLDATISSRLAESAYTAPDNIGIGQIQTDIGNLNDIEVDDILDAEVEGAYTLKEVLRIMVSALAGKANGGGTGTITFRDLSDAVDRIEATVDGVGNRTDITLDVGD